jgi:hypothetical protein
VSFGSYDPTLIRYRPPPYIISVCGLDWILSVLKINHDKIGLAWDASPWVCTSCALEPVLSRMKVSDLPSLSEVIMISRIVASTDACVASIDPSNAVMKSEQ